MTLVAPAWRAGLRRPPGPQPGSGRRSTGNGSHPCPRSSAESEFVLEKREGHYLGQINVISKTTPDLKMNSRNLPPGA